ncbi:MAG TPA: trehalase family glycosidase [Chloroflexota bacterium]|nr:trehalase family glycosidase [Chloroflexota bacterium]
MDPLEELRRPDKWYLGGGRALLWAPPFPAFLDWPGFWDEAHYFDHVIERPFAIALLDESNHAIPLRPLSRDWRPSELTTAWMAGDLLVSERKCLLPQDVLVSELSIWNPTDRAALVRPVVYTLQRSTPSRGDHVVSDVTFDGNAFRYVKRQAVALRGQELPLFSYRLMLGADRPPESFAAQLSEWNSLRPDWQLTPFYERMIQSGLGDELRLAGWNSDGVVYLGLQYTLEVPSESRARLVVGCAVGDELGQLLLQPIELSQQSWRQYFEGLPQLEVSEPYLQRYWFFRWYGLRLNTIDHPDGLAEQPFVAEGIAQFRNHISYSAQCHVLECRWMPSRDVARGSILNFVRHQSSNGAYPGNIYAQLVNSGDMYHANWGRAVRELYAVEPDDDFLRTVYPSLLRYAQFLDDERDPEGCHLYDVVNQGETGQEYMSRYQAVDARADHWGSFRLKGVDATVYAYELQQTLAWLATLLGHAADVAFWKAQANATRQAVVGRMWDAALGMFTDINPESGERTGVKAAVGFYPFLTDLAGPEHVGALRRHLLNPAEFWLPYPVPATAADDTYFSAWADWKGKRESCPWNGRVWPMTNSHVCDGLARASQQLDSSLQPNAVELIQRFVRMMFFDGDVERPNCFEHYNPLTGQPSVYRGIDDYQHSWVVDLLIRYLAGIQPQIDGTVEIDPLPFDVPAFSLTQVSLRGHDLAVAWDAGEGGFRVLLDNREVHQSAERQKLVLQL